MIEAAVGFIIGSVYTFICILAGSLIKEDIDEEEKKSSKDKKHTDNKR